MTDRHTPHQEFVLWIAVNGHTADLVTEHVRSVPTEKCASCEQLWLLRGHPGRRWHPACLRG